MLWKRINPSDRDFRHGFLVARANPRHRRRVATRNREISRTNTQRRLLLSYLVDCLFSLARPSKIHIITVRTERREPPRSAARGWWEREKDSRTVPSKGYVCLGGGRSFVSVSCLGAREGLPSSLPLECSHLEWEPRRLRRRPGPLTRMAVWTECNSSSCVWHVAERRGQILRNMWTVNKSGGPRRS